MPTYTLSIILGVFIAYIGLWLVFQSRKQNVPYQSEDLKENLKLGLYTKNSLGFGYCLIAIGLISLISGLVKILA